MSTIKLLSHQCEKLLFHIFDWFPEGKTWVLKSTPVPLAGIGHNYHRTMADLWCKMVSQYQLMVMLVFINGLLCQCVSTKINENYVVMLFLCLHCPVNVC